MIESSAIATGAAKQFRALSWNVQAGFDKTVVSGSGWFTLDVSYLDGPDKLGFSAERPWQPVDAYNMAAVDSHVMALNIERAVDFPDAVQSAVADFTLANPKGRYSGEPYLLSSRPVRLGFGFDGSVVPLFSGFTDDFAKYEGERENEVSYTALDMLADLGDQKLPNMVMFEDKRTDEILYYILHDMLGVDSYLLDFEQGEVTIPFAWFESKTSVREAMRKIVQAEDGLLYQDEMGIIRFKAHALEQDAGEPVLELTPSNTLSYEQGANARLINAVHVETSIRQVQSRQVIYVQDNENGYSAAAESDTLRLPANATTKIWVQLEDPCVSVETPFVRSASATVAGSIVPVTLSGVVDTAGVSVENLTTFGDRVMIEIKNSNSAARSLKSLTLWGEPARVVQEVNYTAEDTDSVQKFGRSELSITNNDCFGSSANARAYARRAISAYSRYNGDLTASIKGTPLLQIGDVVAVNLTDSVKGNYVVFGVQEQIANASRPAFEMTVKLHKLVEDD